MKTKIFTFGIMILLVLGNAVVLVAKSEEIHMALFSGFDSTIANSVAFEKPLKDVIEA